MKTETLKVTWKIIRKANGKTGRGNTPETYCSYIAENLKHNHNLKTVEGTKLFELLQKTVISHNKLNSDRFTASVVLDGIYHNDKLICVKNPRII